MIALNLTEIKNITSHLFLKDTFDAFRFIEGEVVTFNTFRIDGYIQKDFFDSDAILPEYSCWKDIREYCFSLVRGKRTPVSFRFIFRLSAENTARLIAREAPSIRPEDVQGLYLNLRYDSSGLTCVTGTSFRTFIPDKSLEHVWDEMVQKFFRQHGILFEQAV